MFKGFESAIPLPDDVREAAALAISTFRGVADLPEAQRLQIIGGVSSS